MDVVSSGFQRRPAYRYIRTSDRLPTYAELGDRPLAEITAKIRLFNPTGIGTWWIAAYHPEDGNAWGVAELQCREIGSFSMVELVEFRGRMGLPIERDLHYQPVSIAQLLEEAE
jgi:hypothetical protein